MTLSTPPPALALSKADTYVTFNSDVVAADRFKISISMLAADPGEVLAIAWDDQKEVYVFRLLPDEESELPTRTFQTYPEWYQQLIDEHFINNYALASNWWMTVEEISAGNWYLVFTYKFKENITLKTTTAESNAVSGLILDMPDYSTPLKSAVMSVVNPIAPGNEDYLLTLLGDYDVTTQLVSFNINAAFYQLHPHLPSIISFIPTSTHRRGVATDAFLKYYLRYCERENTDFNYYNFSDLQGPYYMLYGGLSALSNNTFSTALSSPIVCHNYNPTLESAVPKEVGINQPDWVYLWVDLEIPNAYVSTKIYWSDGTSTDYTPSHASPATLLGNTLYWFQSGYRQMRLHEATPPEANLSIIGYDWLLLNADDEVVRSIHFIVECECPPNELYILFDTGLGGMETLRVKGHLTTGYEVQRSTFRVTKYAGYTPADGEVSYFNQRGVAVYQCATGWYDARYIQHLRQMLLADCWLVDVRNNRFVKIIITEDSIRDTSTDSDLFGFEFSFNIAGFDTAYHNF